VSATDTTTEPATSAAAPPPANGANDFLIEVDGKLVPNYDATIKPFEEGDVVNGEVVRIAKEALKAKPAATLAKA